MTKQAQSQGFSVVGALAIVLVIAVIGLGGWYVWHKNHKVQTTKSTNTTAPQTKDNNQNNQTSNQTDPYAGWETYTDTGYTLASGINVKYPADWQVNVGDSKAYAWEIAQKAAPQTRVNVRSVYLDGSKTPQQEWDGCGSADACGAAPGDTKLDSSTSTINGLDTYNVKMQGSSGIYYATIVKGNKSSNNGTVFVEFLLDSNDAAIVNTYRQIVASASF